MSNTVMQNDPFGSSLQELAGLDLENFEAVRFEMLPQMQGGFEVESWVTKGRDTDKGPRLFMECKLRVVEVTAVADPKFESAEAKAGLVGKTHTEGFMIDPTEAEQGLGRIRAFLDDVHYDGSKKVGDLLAGAMNGFKFMGTIVHRPNPKNKDQPYSNVRPVKESATGKIKL